MSLKILLGYAVAIIAGIALGRFLFAKPRDLTFRDVGVALRAFYKMGDKPNIAFDERVAASRKRAGPAAGQTRLVSYAKRGERTVIVEVMVPRKAGESRERLTLDLLRGVTAYQPNLP